MYQTAIQSKVTYLYTDGFNFSSLSLVKECQKLDIKEDESFRLYEGTAVVTCILKHGQTPKYHGLSGI